MMEDLFKMKTLIEKHFESKTDFVFFVIGCIALLMSVVFINDIVNGLELFK